MPNDSSAVSDLIAQTHGRRLRTDPADLVLFDCTNRAQPAPPKRSPLPAHKPAAPRVAPRPAAPRLLDSVLPDPEPGPHALDRFEAPRPAIAEQAEPRDRIWPFVVATIVMAAIGILVPAYVTGAFDADDRLPPIALPSVTPPAPAPIVVPVEPTQAEPTPAPVIEPAAPPAVTTTDTTPATPIVEPTPPGPAKVRPKTKRVAIKRAKPAVAKAVATPVAPKPVAKPVIEEQPRPAPRKRQQQAADSENPL